MSTSKQHDDEAHQDTLNSIQTIVEHQSRNFPAPPPHPVSPPLNIGTPDPNLKHINERARR